jgi:hypothetical protein
MNPTLVAIMANIVAAQARIEGMKAENVKREADGYAPAYDVNAFFVEANLLDQLSIVARNAS